MGLYLKLAERDSATQGYIFMCVYFATTRLVLGRAVAHEQKRGGAKAE
jgi:hypothetical protein